MNSLLLPMDIILKAKRSSLTFFHQYLKNERCHVVLVVMLVLALVMGVSGCGVIDDGRFSATKDIRIDEERTKQELLKTK